VSDAPGPPAPDLDEERRRCREAQTALRHLEERHRLLTQCVKEYAIYEMSPEGCVVSWNEGARRLLGYSDEEAVGQPGAILFTEEDRRAGRPERELREAAAAGTAVDENWAVRKDGSRFWASGFTNALRDEAGHLCGFVKIFRDLTERRAAEQALAESEARLRVALAAARMGTWRWDIRADRDRLDSNLLRLLGLPPDAAVETLAEFLRLVHPDDRPRVEGEFRRCATDGADLNVEFRVVRPDGTVRWLRDQGAVLRDERGRPASLTGACVDITDRRLMEEELRQAGAELERRVEARTAELRQAQERALRAERLAAIGQTVAGLAHEGRNALQAIHACSERLAWRLQDQSEPLALVGEIQKAEEVLQRLFEDVRDYASPVSLDRRPCDLAEVWRQAWEQATAQHPGRDAALEEQTEGLDLACSVDPFRLAQVFRNAFDNSLAAAPGPVRVTVSCAAATLAGAPALRVAVRDNGPGLGPEQRQNLFEAFYTTKTKGTGLGMAIAKRIVDAHGGEIGVGEAAGPGAEIVITLPRSPP
jgi:PAS domain S-box-containing protein